MEGAVFQRIGGVGLVVVVLIFTGVGVRAQSGDDPDPCAHAFGQRDLDACWAREVARAEQEMNQVYLALRNKLPKRGANSLEKAQRLWEEFREAHIAMLYGVESPAATYGREYAMCLSISRTALIRARTRELMRLLEQDGESVCPL
jgi:uncharacterized protein YecT (DUF1311 family)